MLYWASFFCVSLSCFSSSCIRFLSALDLCSVRWIVSWKTSLESQVHHTKARGIASGRAHQRGFIRLQRARVTTARVATIQRERAG